MVKNGERIKMNKQTHTRVMDFTVEHSSCWSGGEVAAGEVRQQNALAN